VFTSDKSEAYAKVSGKEPAANWCRLKCVQRLLRRQRGRWNWLPLPSRAGVPRADWQASRSRAARTAHSRCLARLLCL